MSEFWMEDELKRLYALPCLCEECTDCGGSDCLLCDGDEIIVYCERCEQIDELEMSVSQARREKHGHFGSF